MEDAKEKLGQAIDKIENLKYALDIPLPIIIHVDQLRSALPEIIEYMKKSFIDLTGENPWD